MVDIINKVPTSLALSATSFDENLDEGSVIATISTSTPIPEIPHLLAGPWIR